jgi:hypothetical protein
MTRLALLIAGLLLSFSGALHAQAATDEAPTARPAAAPEPGTLPAPAASGLSPLDALHAPFHSLLQRHVRKGKVDYDALAEERQTLRSYLASLAEASLDDASRDETIAVWVNAYNASTLELILDHWGRIDSIKDISSGKRWKAERWTVAGRRVSLDDMEHEVLRPMGEPRVHFALVCASISCPDLRSEAYLGATLDAQLADATARFLSDRSKGLTIGTSKGFFGGTNHELTLSKIFDWFEEDFEREGGSVVDFVLAHGPADAVAFVTRHRDDLDVEHLDYDWSLNHDPARRRLTGRR